MAMSKIAENAGGIAREERQKWASFCFILFVTRNGIGFNAEVAEIAEEFLGPLMDADLN